MSDSIKGVLEAVKCVEGADHPKYGISYQISLKVDGEWYGGFTKKDADDLGLEKGRVVSFNTIQKGKYVNFDPKSLVVSKTAEAPASSGKASGGKSGSYSGGNNAGIKVGHAINNAVALVAAGKVPVEGSLLRTLHATAVQIIALSVKLESQFDAIVGKAGEVYDKNTTENSAAEAPPTQASSGKKATTKSKAGKKPAPPPPEPEPEPEDDDDAPPVQEPESEPDFDDDIPF